REGILFHNNVSPSSSFHDYYPTPPSPPLRLTDIKDGTSNTLLIGERPPSADYLFGWWFAGGGYDGYCKAGDNYMGVRDTPYLNGLTDTNGAPVKCPMSKLNYQPGKITDLCDQLHFWSLHPGGANWAMADGSVRFLPYAADPLLPALATRNGGEVVNDT